MEDKETVTGQEATPSTAELHRRAIRECAQAGELFRSLVGSPLFRKRVDGTSGLIVPEPTLAREPLLEYPPTARAEVSSVRR